MPENFERGAIEGGDVSLTASQRIAIDQHVTKLLRSWLSWLVIVNLAAILSGLGYIFFILPREAADKARADSSQVIYNLREQLTEIEGELNQARGLTEGLEADVDSIDGRLEKETTNLEVKLKALQLAVSDIETEDLGKLTGYIDSLTRPIAVNEIFANRSIQEGSAFELSRSFVTRGGVILLSIDGTTEPRGDSGLHGVDIEVDGKLVGSSTTYASDGKFASNIVLPSSQLQSGSHSVVVRPVGSEPAQPLEFTNTVLSLTLVEFLG